MLRFRREDVIAVVLDYNGPKMTNASLRSINKFNEIPIVLVNSGDSDVSQYDGNIGFIYVKNRRGRNFSIGMNEGIKVAMAEGARYIVLINNDTEFTEGAIEKLVEALEQDNELGMVGPNHAYQDTFTLRDGSNVKVSHKDKNYPIEFKEKLTGFCLCLRREIIQNVKGFDENFVFTKEDDDLCFRIRKEGYRLAEVKDSIVHHKLGGSTNLGDIQSLRFLMRNNSLGYAILANKKQISVFSAFLLSVKDTSILLSKSFLISRRIYLSALVDTLTGLRDGFKIKYNSPQS